MQKHKCKYGVWHKCPNHYGKEVYRFTEEESEQIRKESPWQADEH